MDRGADDLGGRVGFEFGDSLVGWVGATVAMPCRAKFANVYSNRSLGGGIC